MSSKGILFGLLVLVVIATLKAKPLNSNGVNSSSGQHRRLCGRALVQALEAICVNDLNDYCKFQLFLYITNYIQNN